MNTATKILATLTITFATLGSAHANQFVPADNSLSTKLCVAATKGSKLKLHHAIQAAHLNKQEVIDNVKCNDQSFLSFVENNSKNSEKIINMMTNGKYEQEVTITDIVAAN